MDRNRGETVFRESCGSPAALPSTGAEAEAEQDCPDQQHVPGPVVGMVAQMTEPTVRRPRVRQFPDMRSGDQVTCEQYLPNAIALIVVMRHAGAHRRARWGCADDVAATGDGGGGGPGSDDEAVVRSLAWSARFSRASPGY